MTKEYKIGKITEAELPDGKKAIQIPVNVTEQAGVRHGEHGEEIPIIKTERFGVTILEADLPLNDRAKYIENAVKTAYRTYLSGLTKYSEYENISFSE